MKPFVPHELPLKDLDYGRILPFASKANRELGRYDGSLMGIPNPAVMLSPLTTHEAVLSSRIEGTQATVDEVMEQEAGILKEGHKYLDIQEILNYRKALIQASEYLTQRPIGLSLVLDLHKILLDSVRGQDKMPGEFRRDQNWIGEPGTTLEQAIFIPPNALQLRDHLEAWERYLQSDDSDYLIQTAIVHAQFELLHPFKDGNGRIGRILIPLFLFQKKVLSQPMFYLSEYLESHREEYYARLKAISADGDWNGWIVFFLKAVAEQAAQNEKRVKAIHGLYDQMKMEVQEVTRSQYTVHLLDGIFSRPIFRTSDLVKQLNQKFNIHRQTANGLLRQLKEAQVLREIQAASGRRPAVLCFPKLINLAEGRKIF